MIILPIFPMFLFPSYLGFIFVLALLLGSVIYLVRRKK